MVGDSLIEDSNYAYLNHPFIWQTAFPKIFADGGFDIVLGNPPYVRMEFLNAMKPYLEKRFEVVSDRADLYAYFFERGLKLLKDGGHMGYISSATFFKIGSGKPLREFLLREATLETIVDFGDLQVFEGVTTYPAILAMQRNVPTKAHDLQFWNVAELPASNFRATYRGHAGPYPQSALGVDSWELESPALLALRQKISTGHTPLKDVYGKPLYGVKTGLNPAFVIDDQTKQELCSRDPSSTDLLKPFVEGKHLKRWRSEPIGKWLILMRKGWTKARYPTATMVDAFEYLSSDYPAIAEWHPPSGTQGAIQHDTSMGNP
ncbi:Eco57I restriction-modification methylase domain-containing protein [Epibacterium ulvae]|uniref:Eco57I restriction-modification methylase domain-containing protein n=1 Tax=Epibacterium ulvae TaxID=1156985 RepID=UPI002490694A|nr:Eco57I restriction-modification methylase domain-containing protein [Epibacterium ulvae]